MTRTCLLLAIASCIGCFSSASACTLPAGYEPITTKAQLQSIRTCYPSTSCPTDAGVSYNDRHYMVMNDIEVANFAPIFTQFRGKLIGCHDNPPVLRNTRIVSASAGYVGLFAQIAGSAEIKDLVFENFEISAAGNAAVVAAQMLGNAQVHRIVFRKASTSDLARVRSTGSQSTGGNAALVAAFADQTSEGSCLPSVGQSNASCLSIRDITITGVTGSSGPGTLPEVEALKGNAGGIAARMADGVISGVVGSIAVKGHESAGGIVASLFPAEATGALIENVRLSADVETLEYGNFPCYHVTQLACGSAGGVVGVTTGPSTIYRSGMTGSVRAHLFAGGLAGNIAHAGSVIENSYVQSDVRQLHASQLEDQEIGGAAGIAGNAAGTMRFVYSSVTGLSAMFDRASAFVYSAESGVAVYDSFYDAELLPSALTGLSLGVGLLTNELQSEPSSPLFPYATWSTSIWGFQDGSYPFLHDSMPCYVDFDGNGTIGVEDIFAFLSYWFAVNPLADANSNGQVQVDDIFTFLSLWFLAMAGGGSC